MVDLYLGLMILMAIAVVGFWSAVRVTRSGPDYRCDLLALQTLLMMAWYIVNIWNRVSISRYLPFANLVVVGNWFLPFAGVMAGLAWRRVREHPVRRWIATAALPVIGLYSAVYPILGEHPVCAEQWQDGICLQTSESTCSPASAATLLKAHGIEATEKELAELCLTRNGTTWAGLYRGLKHKTRGTDWDVELFECRLIDLQKRVRSGNGPILLSVGVSEETSRDDEYVSDWGLTPGQMHTVVLFRALGGQACVIGDPAIGRELWSWGDVKRLWQGQGIRLVPRVKTDAVAAFTPRKH